MGRKREREREIQKKIEEWREIVNEERETHFVSGAEEGGTGNETEGNRKEGNRSIYSLQF